VAEGVETPEQLAYLQGHDCRYFQGFHFSRPIEAGLFAGQYLA
jgi:diguanylate cyclase